MNKEGKKDHGGRMREVVFKTMDKRIKEIPGLFLKMEKPDLNTG